MVNIDKIGTSILLRRRNFIIFLLSFQFNIVALLIIFEIFSSIPDLSESKPNPHQSAPHNEEKATEHENVGLKVKGLLLAFCNFSFVWGQEEEVLF